MSSRTRLMASKAIGRLACQRTGSYINIQRLSELLLERVARHDDMPQLVVKMVKIYECVASNCGTNH